MQLDPYDELEWENIRSGVFEVDSGRVGAMGEAFLRKVRGTQKNQSRQSKKLNVVIVSIFRSTESSLL